MEWLVAPLYKEVGIIPFIALLVVAVYLFYLIFAALSPKVAAIAFSTFKTEVSQPLFTIVMVLGILFILLTIYVPYNTFGEDIKMYKDSGLTLIRVLAIFLAIWASSKSVAEEIEGRTALTVLSKPVGRRQFVLGKFTGIGIAVALLFIVLGLWFYIWVSYKPIYDYQENARGIAEWTTCYIEAIHTMPGLFLCFLEVLIFVAISVAISTRFGILANFLICFSIYVLGHLTPLIVQSSYAAFEPVVVFGQLVAIIFPVLNHFDVQAAINTNTPVPFAYLGWSVIYTALYGTIAMLLALVLFEDRDLA
jgi:ABC-type transport system involved in multi-copper enzyme maturation permease subunit